MGQGHRLGLHLRKAPNVWHTSRLCRPARDAPERRLPRLSAGRPPRSAPPLLPTRRRAPGGRRGAADGARSTPDFSTPGLRERPQRNSPPVLERLVPLLWQAPLLADLHQRPRRHPAQTRTRPVAPDHRGRRPAASDLRRLRATGSDHQRRLQGPPHARALPARYAPGLPRLASRQGPPAHSGAAT
eukprot:1109827-Pleurochrysis_carterae.AAC.1